VIVRTINARGVEEHGFLCGEHDRKPDVKCHYCERNGAFLCDGPCGDHKSGTCDRPLCGVCRHQQTLDRIETVDMEPEYVRFGVLPHGIERLRVEGELTKRYIDSFDLCRECDDKARCR
jgi:hypothetical protein